MFGRKKKKEEVTCNGCGAVVNMELAFCGECGAKIEKDEPAVEVVAEEIVTDEAVEETTVLEEEKSDEEEQQEPVEETGRDKILADMVKEVEIFSTEGEFEMKRNWFGTIFFILIILAIIATGVILFLNRDEADKKTTGPDDTKIKYTYTEIEDGIEFYKDKDLINTYSCTNEICSVYKVGEHGYFSFEPTIIILTDGEYVFLYDYVEDKRISENYMQLQNLKDGNNTVAFIAYAEEGTGIIDTKGEVIIPLEYSSLGYSLNDGEVADYSYDKKIISASNESGWGLISLETGEEIVSFQYEDIFYNGTDSYVAKIGPEWFIFDMDGEKILDNGYDIIIPIRRYIYVAKDGVFSIFSDRAVSMVSDEIPTFQVGFRSRVEEVVPTFKTEMDESTVTIYIMENSTDYVEYNFNTVNGDLTKIIR